MVIVGLLLLAGNALDGLACTYFLAALTRAHLFRWPVQRHSFPLPAGLNDESAIEAILLLTYPAVMD